MAEDRDGGGTTPPQSPAPFPPSATDDNFTLGVKDGLGIGVFYFLIADLLGGADGNGALITAAIGLLLLVGYVINALIQPRRTVTLGYTAGTVLAPLFFAAMLLCSAGRGVLNEYEAIPAVEQFGHQDLERIAGGPNVVGVWTADQLQAVLNRQTALKTTIINLAVAEEANKLVPTKDGAEAFTTKTTALIADVQGQLLPADVIDRLQVVSGLVCKIGVKMDLPETGKVCVVSKTNLTSYGYAVELRYGLWWPILHALHQV